ncbi:8-amino-7-oxononanoate synthase [Moniliophthora roreri]|nr:8-amino-7-oxononanoate synthase [Moniliophthora roreri]
MIPISSRGEPLQHGRERRATEVDDRNSRRTVPLGNACMIVDEAYVAGVCGPQGRGRMALEGLEGHPRILARLCTFGKVLAAGGAVVLTMPLVAKYLTNYARHLIYTTTLSQLSVIAASCSFGMPQDGTVERQA